MAGRCGNDLSSGACGGWGGTDIPYLDGGHVSYLMGPGSITVAHRPDEAMNKQELGNHVYLYEDLISAILAQGPGQARTLRQQ